MTIYYKAESRKPLVQAVSEFTGVKAIYMRTPTCAYKIGSYTVTREGNLDFDETDMTVSEQLIKFLKSKGHTADEKLQTEPKKTTEENSEDIGLTIAMPAYRVSVVNLNNLLNSKQCLIKKALGIDSLPIEATDKQVLFPWFEQIPDADTARAYTNFIAAICRMSVEQIRISKAEKPVTNEKYAFRCFLLRLGFVGEKYKTDRKILLKKLTGSSAFKCGGTV